MEVRFSADKEARLQEFAARTGKEPSQLVEEAVDRMLEYDTRFIEAVEVGRESARDLGHIVEPETRAHRNVIGNGTSLRADSGWSVVG